MPQEISLYIHIPFCKRKCRYCDFFSVPYTETACRETLHACVEEWRRIVDEKNLYEREITTVYIGGGTPSCLSPELWEYLSRHLLTALPLSPECEFTLECNPESYTPEKASQWRSSGVNRLSIGVQSCDSRMLRFLGRVHDTTAVRSILTDPSLGAFRSVNADVLYAVPGQSIESIDRTCSELLSHLCITHLSAYELTLYDKTPLARHRRLLPRQTEEESVAMAEEIVRHLEEAGFRRYEVSNFARRGHRCRHNMRYWRHEPYIGLGPAAHSYLPPFRWSNTADIDSYTTALHRGTRPVAMCEEIDSQRCAREMIFLALRTTDGLNEEHFYQKTGMHFADSRRRPHLDILCEAGMMYRHGSFWRLSDSGILLADAIAARLI
jgi:oxygen-independent coproporphyrinogen-3 oxidase